TFSRAGLKRHHTVVGEFPVAGRCPVPGKVATLQKINPGRLVLHLRRGHADERNQEGAGRGEAEHGTAEARKHHDALLEKWFNPLKVTVPRFLSRCHLHPDIVAPAPAITSLA